MEATVGQWLKREGDAVAAGEPVVQLETEKVNLQVAADADGLLERIAAPAGVTVKVGDLLGTVVEKASGTGEQMSGAGTQTRAVGEVAASTGAEQVARKAEPTTTTTAAGSGPSETAPSGVADHTPAASPVARRMADEHGINVGAVAGTGPGGRVVQADVERYLAEHPSTTTAPTAPPTSVQQAATPPTEPAYVSPIPPPSTVLPPGPPSLPPPAAPTTPSVPPTPDTRHLKPETRYPTPAVPLETAPLPTETRAAPPNGRSEERLRMSRRRLTIARRLVEAQQETASLTTFNEIDMSAVMDVRRRRKESFQARNGVGLGFMSFFVKASVAALKAFPHVNAELQGDEIILKRYYDVGVAVDTEGGLVVPVVRNADQKSFAAIEREIAELARRARENQLTLDELRGGTFTITNGGIFGSLLSTPIINPPQVAILGMHRIVERPIALNGEVVIHPMMYAALTYDHRVIDGRTAVQFLVRLKELIEDPEALLLEG